MRFVRLEQDIEATSCEGSNRSFDPIHGFRDSFSLGIIFSESVWKTQSASAQPYICPVDVTHYLNKRKPTKPGEVMCLLTKSVLYQKRGRERGKNTHQFSELRNKPLYNSSDGKRTSTCMNLVPREFISYWSLNLWRRIEMFLVSLFIVNFSDFSLLRQWYKDYSVLRCNAYNFVDYFNVQINLSPASSEMLGPSHLRAQRNDLEDRIQIFFC